MKTIHGVDIPKDHPWNKNLMTIDSKQLWNKLKEFKCCNEPCPSGITHTDGHYFELMIDNEFTKVGTCDCGLTLVKTFARMDNTLVKETLIVPKVTETMYQK